MVKGKGRGVIGVEKMEKIELDPNLETNPTGVSLARAIKQVADKVNELVEVANKPVVPVS